MPWPCVVLRSLVLLLCLENGYAHAEIKIRNGSVNVAVPIKSFLDIREAKLVRQGWDISCGAAALSTVLTYELEKPYSEATIAVSILANTDPQKIRARGGFSLLDLKRFSEAVGLTATGYGDMTQEDLAKGGVAILPVRIRGFDHFVVFRRHLGSRVELGDPAFGNMVVSSQQFAKMWTSRVAFYVQSADKQPVPPATSLTELALADMRFVQRTRKRTALSSFHHLPQPDITR